MCPPLLAKGANCLLALKGGHLLSRARDIHTAVKLKHISKTGEYKTDLKCPLEQHDPWFNGYCRCNDCLKNHLMLSPNRDITGLNNCDIYPINNISHN